jgi:hypothetical protein
MRPKHDGAWRHHVNTFLKDALILLNALDSEQAPLWLLRYTCELAKLHSPQGGSGPIAT